MLQMLMSDIENKKEFKAEVSAELAEAIDCRVSKIKVTVPLGELNASPLVSSFS